MLVLLVLGLRRAAARRHGPASGGACRPSSARAGLLAGAFFGMDALLPLALTQLHGYSPAAAGIPLTAGALGWAAASQLQGRRPEASRVALLRARVRAAGRRPGRHRRRSPCPGAGGWPAYLSWAVAGLGMGLGMPSVGVLLLEQSPEHRRGADSAAFQIADVTGSALCVGFVGVLVAATTAGVLPLRAAVLIAVAVLALLAATGTLVAPRAGAPAPPPAGARARSDGATTLAT